jgi:hypothetical protein
MYETSSRKTEKCLNAGCGPAFCLTSCNQTAEGNHSYLGYLTSLRLYFLSSKCTRPELCPEMLQNMFCLENKKCWKYEYQLTYSSLTSYSLRRVEKANTVSRTRLNKKCDSVLRDERVVSVEMARKAETRRRFWIKSALWSMNLCALFFVMLEKTRFLGENLLQSDRVTLFGKFWPRNLIPRKALVFPWNCVRIFIA